MNSPRFEVRLVGSSARRLVGSSARRLVYKVLTVALIALAASSSGKAQLVYPCNWAYWNNLPGGEPPHAFPQPVQPCSAVGDDLFRSIANPQVQISSCCQSLAWANLPDWLPDLEMPVSLATFDGCQLEQQLDVDLEFRSFIRAAFSSPPCHQYREFRMYLKLNGLVFMAIEPTEGYMRYTRSFFLPGVQGEPDRQVWRYTLNADAKYDVAATPSFWLPPCYACPTSAVDQFARVHFVGHIDYSCAMDELGQPHWEAAISLSHHTGCVSHLDNPTLNPLRRITAPNTNRHEVKSYHMVGPLPFTYLAAPPAPQSVVVSNGGVKFDAVRSTVIKQAPLIPPPNPRATPMPCLTESSLFTVMQADMTDCLCEAAPSAPPIYYHARIRPALSQAACVDPLGNIGATSWRSIDSISPDIPQGFVQLYLGHWGLAGDWEGQALLHNIGLIEHLNHCYQNADYSFHITHGVTTLHDPNVRLPHFYDDPLVSSDLLIDFVDQVRDMSHLHHMGSNLAPIAAGSSLSSLIWTISKE